LEIVGDFWHRRVVGGDPPPVDGAPATTAAIAARYQQSEPELVADLSAYGPQLQKLWQLKDEIKVLETDQTALENGIKQVMGEAEAGDVDGVRAVTWKTSSSKRIDTGRLRDERPEIAAEFTTESTIRRFLLKDFGGDR
jgi:predicted phage-related endonuclease